MKATTLQREIIKRGGTAEVIKETVKDFRGEPWESAALVGALKGNDIEMNLNNGHTYTGENDFFTVRPQSRRGEYDQGSDYNPGGFTFCNRIKDLDWAVR